LWDHFFGKIVFSFEYVRTRWTQLATAFRVNSGTTLTMRFLPCQSLPLTRPSSCSVPRAVCSIRQIVKYYFHKRVIWLRNQKWNIEDNWVSKWSIILELYNFLTVGKTYKIKRTILTANFMTNLFLDDHKHSFPRKMQKTVLQGSKPHIGRRTEGEAKEFFFSSNEAMVFRNFQQ
jgi:hypothetical protein